MHMHTKTMNVYSSTVPNIRIMMTHMSIYIWKCVYVSGAQSCPTLCYSMNYSPAGSSVNGIFQARKVEWVANSSPRDLPDPGIKPESPVSTALQANSLPSEPLRKYPNAHPLCILIYP